MDEIPTIREHIAARSPVNTARVIDVDNVQMDLTEEMCDNDYDVDAEEQQHIDTPHTIIVTPAPAPSPDPILSRGAPIRAEPYSSLSRPLEPSLIIDYSTMIAHTTPHDSSELDLLSSPHSAQLDTSLLNDSHAPLSDATSAHNNATPTRVRTEEAAPVTSPTSETESERVRRRRAFAAESRVAMEDQFAALMVEAERLKLNDNRRGAVPISDKLAAMKRLSKDKDRNGNAQRRHGGGGGGGDGDAAAVRVSSPQAKSPHSTLNTSPSVDVESMRADRERRAANVAAMQEKRSGMATRLKRAGITATPPPTKKVVREQTTEET